MCIHITYIDNNTHTYLYTYTQKEKGTNQLIKNDSKHAVLDLNYNRMITFTILF